MERGKILDEAKGIINGERVNTYGKPEDSFTFIAEFWTAHLHACGYMPLDKKLTKKDAQMMLAEFKFARETQQGKRDNLVDAAGYIGLAGDDYDS